MASSNQQQSGTWSSSLSTLSSLYGRRQKVLSYLKSKRDEYMMDSDDEMSQGRDSASTRSPTSTPDQSPVINDPFPDEKLTVYPGYSRQIKLENGKLGYEANISGVLWRPGLQNRKNKIMYSLAKQIAGVSSTDTTTSTTSAVSSSAASSGGSSNAPSSGRKPTRSRTSTGIIEEEIGQLESKLVDVWGESGDDDASSYATGSELKQSEMERVLRERIAPFLARPAPYRLLTIHDSDNRINKEVLTTQNGKFAEQISLDTPISDRLWIEASDELRVSVDVKFIEAEGISVISDIDDTCKKTGVTGVKREMFRNVFVKEHADIQVDGVVDWYNALAKQGNCTFHYVSNSPYQLYSIISDFLTSSGLPSGTIHLKQYTGLINGFLEPSQERKRAALNKLLDQFPKRKFILIGDSGEVDLEAYCELADRYPDQIIAIYIHDITTPNKMKLTLSDETSENSGENTSSDTSENITGDRRVRPKDSAGGAPPPLPARNEPLMIDLDFEPVQPPKIPPRPSFMEVNADAQPDQKPGKKNGPPSVPKKPSHLRGQAFKDSTSSSAPEPTNKNFTNNDTTAPPQSSKMYLQRQSQSPRRLIEIPPEVPAESSLFDWLIRVRKAQATLPSHIDFHLWRSGKDIVQHSLNLVKEQRSNKN